MRALLAAAAGVPPRHPPAGNSDGAAEPRFAGRGIGGDQN
jgi:hypothetical protein